MNSPLALTRFLRLLAVLMACTLTITISLGCEPAEDTGDDQPGETALADDTGAGDAPADASGEESTDDETPDADPAETGTPGEEATDEETPDSEEEPAQEEPAQEETPAEPQNVPPGGYTALFNGENLDGWVGLSATPTEKQQLNIGELAEGQEAANEEMREHWSVENGELVFDGEGNNICSVLKYADFELYVDWKIEEGGDSGIYLRDTPQVQIWDPANEGIGSGGLYNNEQAENPSQPLVQADNPVGQWNTFYIRMWGDHVTVVLNGQLVVDNVSMENYWDRSKPIYPWGQIELQAHGSPVRFRNIFIRELVTEVQAQMVEEALPAAPSVEPAEPRKVLALARATGFRHSSIPINARAVQQLGAATGAYDCTISEDITLLAPGSIDQFDAIVMCNNTGDWIIANEADAARLSTADKTYTPEEATELLKQSLLDYIAAGGGIAGIHSATDANYAWPEYGELIGGWFAGHPWHEDVGLRLERPDSPLSEAFGDEPFSVVDEIYQFRDPYNREALMVLLSLDPERAEVGKGQGGAEGDYPVAWIREQGKGRVFYCSLGHREEIFWNPTLLKFYLDGIQYAIGDLEADFTPGFPEGLAPEEPAEETATEEPVDETAEETVPEEPAHETPAEEPAAEESAAEETVEEEPVAEEPVEEE